MNYLAIAQYMAFAVFLTIALIHWLVWYRAQRETSHLLFALTAAAAGANAIAEANMYRADSIDAMSSALRWYVATSGCWAIAAVCFILSYAPLGRLGKYVAAVIVSVCLGAMTINLLSPASFLYTELTGLREMTLPWGERIWLAVGKDNPWRLASEVAFASILGLVAGGSYRFWLLGKHRRAIVFGAAGFLFMLCFGTHAFLVDTGRIDSPYLSTYGFLALVGLTSYDLAGEVTRSLQLSSELQRVEREMRTAVADERNRIARELHDSVTQTLFSTAAIADALPEVWRRSPKDAMRGLDDLKLMAKGALAEMRSLLLELHPATLSSKDLSVLLQQLADSSTGRMRVPVDVQIDGFIKVPESVQLALYRVAQESLNNVGKHARATQVWLSLVCRDPHATLTIRDDGRGFDQNTKSSGMGLQIMQERVEAIGGRFELHSETHVGTSITVHWNRDSNVRDDSVRG
jgi:signal transduction histidine kinase